MAHDNKDLADELRSSWEANAQVWTQAVRAQTIESRRLVTDQAMLAAIQACQPRKVLDLGCGEGWLTRQLVEQGIETVGIDGSAALISAAQATGTGRFLQLSYADLQNDPQACGSDFDLLAANFALLDQDLAPLLQSMRKICAASAHLLIQTLHPHRLEPPYHDGWRRENFQAFDQPGWTPMPWYFRTLGSWIALLHSSGWQLESLSEPQHPDTGQVLSLILSANIKIT